RKFSPHDMCATSIHYMIKIGLSKSQIVDISGRTEQTIDRFYDINTEEELLEGLNKLVEVLK
ncbi:MAG: hypothetical protein ACXAC7_21895, partial [Candidatus Hodarchaeales archaeon]